LRQGAAREACGGEKAIRAMTVAGLGGKAGHGCTDEICQTLSVFGVTGGDVAVDHLLRRGVDGAGGLAGLRVIAVNPLEHEAARGGGVGRVATGSILQQCQEGFGDGAVGLQEIIQGNGIGLGVSAEHAGIEASLAAEGGIEAWGVDAECFSYVSDTHGIVAARPKKPLGGGNRLIEIELPRAPPGAWIICSHNYKIP